MAFTLPTYVADPTLITGNVRLPKYVADPTLITEDVRLPKPVSDPTAALESANLPVFIANPTIALESANLPVFVADSALITGNTHIPAFVAEGLPASVKGIVIQMQPFVLSANGYVGDIGNFAQTMAAFTLDMTGVQQPPLVMENFIASMTGYSGFIATMSLRMEQFISAMTSDPFGSIDVEPQGFDLSMTGLNGGIGALAGTMQYMTSSMTGYVQVTGTIDITVRPFGSYMSGDTGIGLNYTTLTMHTEWQALTQYTNYPFNSFARFNDVSLGASSTGLYRLTGDTDNGTAIAAVAKVGISDMGTSHLKKTEFVYVGCRATGDLLLRLNTNDSHVRDYRVKHNGETGLHVKRVKLGKGVVARYWQFEVQNIDGADFDLNTLEIKPTVLSRRISGGRA